MRILSHAIADPEAARDFHGESSGKDPALLDRFWKELVCEGVFVHPTQPGVIVDVDLPRMEKWKRQFERMREVGLAVPLPYGHRNRWNSREHAGFVDDLEIRQRADGRYGLWGLCDIPKPGDAENIGTTVRGVSIGIEHDYRSADGEGKLHHWGEVLDHVALTNDPVVYMTDGFEPVEIDLPREEAVATGFHRGIEEDLSFRVTMLSREQPAASTRAWKDVDRSRLPASAHLHVSDPEQPSTWKLPIFEGAGALVDGPAGGKLYARRGPVNLEGLAAAAAAIAGEAEDLGLSAEERRQLAREVARILRENGRRPEKELLEATGLALTWLDSLEAEDIPTVAEVIADDEFREKAWKGINALDEVIYRVIGTDELTSAEKRDRILEAIDQFRDVFGEQTSEQMERIRSELARAAGLEPRSSDGHPGKKPGKHLEERDMKLSVLKNLKPLARRLDLSLEDDADEATFDSFLERVLAELSREGEDPPEETPREKELRERLERVELEGRIGSVKDGRRIAQDLQKAGAITKEQRALLEKILSVRSAKVATLSQEGGQESLTEEDADLRGLVIEFARAIPAGTVTGRRHVVQDPRPGEEDPKSELEARKSDVEEMVGAAGHDPRSGYPRGALPAGS